MQDALPPAESREPESTPPPVIVPAVPFEPPLLVLASLPEREPPVERPPVPPQPVAPTTPILMEVPRTSAELIAPTVVATAPPPPPPPPSPPPAQPALAGAAAALPAIEKGRWVAVFAHLLLFAAIPTIFLGGVVTFFLWQILGKDDPFIEDQAREALNFQINVALLTFLMAASIIGLPLVILLWIVAGIVCLIAALHASRGERYRYPAILRIVSH
jgi:hypothetical protein